MSSTLERYTKPVFHHSWLSLEVALHPKSCTDEDQEDTAYTAPSKPYSWGVSFTHTRCSEEYWTGSDNRGCGGGSGGRRGEERWGGRS